MKPLIALLVLASAIPTGSQYSRYQRTLTPTSAGQTCTILPADLFPHANPQLTDLRLYRDGTTETPYALRTSFSQSSAEQPVQILNLGDENGLAAFDAAMPSTGYSTVHLNLSAKDFVATVTVLGRHSQNGPSTKLGDFTIFDLTHQQLGRSTVLHLPPSDFALLHLRISKPIVPTDIEGLTLDSASLAEPRYQLVARTSSTTQHDHHTLIEFTLPPHVPVDRVAFTFGPTPAAFSRDVRITAAPQTSRPTSTDAIPAEPTISNGSILRLHTTQEGHRIDEEQNTIDLSTAPSDTATQWTVSIDNGDDAPLTLNDIRLEMLQRSLCFEAAPATTYTLTYGDPALEAPRYDYATLFTPNSSAPTVTLGPEQPNPNFQPRPDDRPFSERHSTLLWIALLAVLALLGFVALRSMPRPAPGK
jgi:hypothetical protein